MKKTLITALFSLLLAAASSAATIAVGRGGATNGYTVFEGFLNGVAGKNLSITGGFYIAVGTYATEPVITNVAQFQSAVANFQVFASANSPTTGTTLGSVTGSFVATNAAFNGAPLYILIGNGTTRENSTSFAILKGNPTAFNFPATAGQPSGSGTVTLTGAAVASPVGFAGRQVEVAGAPDTLVLGFAPEPSSALLGLLGVVGLMRRRR